MKLDLEKLKAAQKRAKLELRVLKEAGFNISDANATVDDVREQFDKLLSRQARRSRADEANDEKDENFESQENKAIVADSTLREDCTLIPAKVHVTEGCPDTTEVSEGPSNFFLGEAAYSDTGVQVSEQELNLAGIISEALARRKARQLSPKKLSNDAQSSSPTRSIGTLTQRSSQFAKLQKTLRSAADVPAFGDIAGRSKTGLFSRDRVKQEQLRTETLQKSDARLRKIHDDLMAKIAAEKEIERKKKLKRLYGARKFPAPKTRYMRGANTSPHKRSPIRAVLASELKRDANVGNNGTPIRNGETISADVSSLQGLYKVIGELNRKIERLETVPVDRVTRVSVAPVESLKPQNRGKLLDSALQMLTEIEAKDQEWKILLDELEQSRVERETPLLTEETMELVSDDSSDLRAEAKYVVNTNEKPSAEMSGNFRRPLAIALKTSQVNSVYDYREAVKASYKAARYTVDGFIVPRTINLENFIKSFSRDLTMALLDNAAKELALSTDRISRDLFNQELMD